MLKIISNGTNLKLGVESGPAEFLSGSFGPGEERESESEREGDIKYDWQFSVIQCRRVAPLSAVNQSCHIQKRERKVTDDDWTLKRKEGGIPAKKVHSFEKPFSPSIA